jgi:hypothetical protein
MEAAYLLCQLIAGGYETDHLSNIIDRHFKPSGKRAGY